ncbi:MAG TPA: energy transducer TonB, partial [Candidatus Eisenbacteria bacterium]|nr:energy transducer TonB [Candidatus Eisenbacteria bacterium]
AAGADEPLRPPIARGLAVLHLRGARPGWVELDVRVDAGGRVTDARPAAGEADSATVAEAVRAARAMRYLPALLGGRPVAVWCRQRLEISR